jgi:hypothetical protein
MKSFINEGIQGNVVADMVVVGRGARATKTVHLERTEGAVDAVNSAHSHGHRVSLSYRRADSAAMVGRICDRLITELGPKGVFQDVNNIPFGVNFLDHLKSAIQKSTVLLVVIGRDWLSVSNPAGFRRLDDPNDIVRIEIEVALQCRLLIVPLLIDGAVMPLADQLPISLQPLAFCNGTAIRADPDFHTDMSRLMSRIATPDKGERKGT